MTPTAEELIRQLSDSERRYAELAAYINDIGCESGRKLLAKHARENGMSDWHERYGAFHCQQPLPVPPPENMIEEKTNCSPSRSEKLSAMVEWLIQYQEGWHGPRSQWTKKHRDDFDSQAGFLMLFVDGFKFTKP